METHGEVEKLIYYKKKQTIFIGVDGYREAAYKKLTFTIYSLRSTDTYSHSHHTNVLRWFPRKCCI